MTLQNVWSVGILLHIISLFEAVIWYSEALKTLNIIIDTCIHQSFINMIHYNSNSEIATCAPLERHTRGSQGVVSIATVHTMN